EIQAVEVVLLGEHQGGIILLQLGDEAPGGTGKTVAAAPVESRETTPFRVGRTEVERVVTAHAVELGAGREDVVLVGPGAAQDGAPFAAESVPAIVDGEIEPRGFLVVLIDVAGHEGLEV